MARANAEALVARIATEPGVSPERANLLNAALVSLHGFARAVMALESALYRPEPEHAEPAAIEFANKVDQTLRALVEALRVSHAPQGDLPNLREAHNLFEDSYNLVGVETDRIVTSLNTLREQVEKLFNARSVLRRRLVYAVYNQNRRLHLPWLELEAELFADRFEYGNRAVGL